jgi:hypothetical protein
MTELPPIVGRAAALALLFALVFLITVTAVLPLAERFQATDEALAHNRELVDRLTRRLANRGSYDAQIDALQARVNKSGLYIRADTEPLAAAAVQEHLKRAVGLHGGDLRSVQSLPSQQEDDLTRIGLRVVMTGGLGQMLQVLHELETGEPYLFADNLQVKSTKRRRRRVQVEAPTANVLSIRFDLYGYLPPEAEE